MSKYYYTVRISNRDITFHNADKNDQINNAAREQLESIFQGISPLFWNVDYGNGNYFYPIRIKNDSEYVVDFFIYSDVYTVLNSRLQSLLLRDNLPALVNDDGKCIYCDK